MFFCVTRNGRANGKFVAEQEAFLVLFSCFPRHYCLKFCRTRIPSRRSKIDLRDNQSDCSIRTTKPYNPIISLHTNYEAVQANHIVPYGLRSRIIQSDSSIRTTKPYKPINLFLTDYKAVQANQIVPYGLRIRTKPIISLQIAWTVTGKKFRKYQVTCMIIDRPSDETKRSFRKDQVIHKIGRSDPQS